MVVEKPFTVSIPEADHVIALAKEKGKILTVFQSKPAVHHPPTLFLPLSRVRVQNSRITPLAIQTAATTPTS